MLKGTSWGQFVMLMMILVIIYYLVVAVVYYRVEIMRAFGRGRRLPGRMQVEDPEEDGEGETGGEITGEVLPDCEASRQKELFVASEAGRDQNDLFPVMQKVVAVLRDVIAQAAADKWEAGDVKGHIKEVLGAYRRLKGTPYEGTINGFLMRACVSELSLELSDVEVAALWD